MRVSENSDAFHSLDRISNIEIINTSIRSNWRNVYVYTLRISPFNSVFPSVSSLTVGMVIGGCLRGRWVSNGVTYNLDVHPGTIFILPNDTRVEARIESYAEVISVYVGKDIINGVGRAFQDQVKCGFSIDHQVAVTDYFLEQVMLSLRELVEYGGRFSKVEAEHLVQVLAMRVISKYSTLAATPKSIDTGLPSNVLEKTFDLIDNNLDQRISVDRIARTAGIGPAHFARLFKKTTNTTLQQYIIRRRVDRARFLLTETQKPIAEIAQECGFADQVHLTRFFGRIVGTSPASFRRRTRG